MPISRLAPLRATFRRTAKALILGLAFATLASKAQAPMDVRVALVIGNGGYQHFSKLSNTGNDAKSMAAVLRKLGFTVVEMIDGDRSEMARSVERLQSQLRGQQAVAMLYYAGHGLQLDWHNFMVPVDALLRQASDVPAQTIDVEDIIAAFKKAGTRMNIIVLDACREDPFAEVLGTKGLAPMDAPPGTYLAYATAPGNLAEDGDVESGNGLFTQFLLKELQRPANIESLFKRVRLQVRQKSQGRQIPWDSSSLEEEFAFNDGAKYTFNPEDLLREAREKESRLQREADAAAAQADILARQQQTALAAERERQHAVAAAQAAEKVRLAELSRVKDLELAKDQAEEEARRKKMGLNEARERQFAQEKAEWDKIKDSKTASDFYAFLLKYPNGLISHQAYFALEQLDKAKITAQVDRYGRAQHTGRPRLLVGDRWVQVVRDGYTNNLLNRTELRVTRVEDGLAYIQSAQGEFTVTTVDGGLVKYRNSFGAHSFDPPYAWVPADGFQVGKKWSVATAQSTNGGPQRQRNDDLKIVAYEQVTVPAGTFWTYKIESRGWIGNVRVEQTYWIEPDQGTSLRIIRKSFPAKDMFSGSTPSIEIVEIESRSMVERPAMLGTGGH